MVFSRGTVSVNRLEILNIMDWIPVVFITFKLIVFGVGMFFAIKWHYDKGKKKKLEQAKIDAQDTSKP